MKNLLLSLMLLLSTAIQNTSAMAGSTQTVTDFVTHTDNYLLQLAEQDEFSGVVLVALNDKVLLRKGYGYAAPGVPNNPSTRFCIGSITKSFTAVVMLQLAQEGKLNINDPVQKWIPAFKHADVTIHQLLNMTSGLPCDYWTPQDFKSNPQTQSRATTWGTEYLIDEYNNQCTRTRAYTQDLLSLPGTAFEYSNMGYLLLTDIIALADGCSYAQSLQQRIFTPLQMHTATAAPVPNDPCVAQQTGIPFEVLEDGYNIALESAHGAGSIVATIDDIYTWAQCIKHNWLLDNKYTNIMQQPSECELYGCGLVVEDKQSLKRVIWHDGGVSYFSSYMGIHKYQNTEHGVLTIIVLANKRETAKPVAQSICTIFETKQQVPLQTLTKTASADIADEILGQYHTDKNDQSIWLKTGQENTLWLCQHDVSRLHLLKTEKTDTFGSNILGLTLKLERNEHTHEITSFSATDGDGEVSHFRKAT